ncbi:MAG: sn-glycerol-3-phosphate ABC transporter ATP-binding protein UgpC, partial [Clostridia bacterium]|nr:sn-glycerol-3-phosphate ABC transporter ATP-binding protein UgpC [Clostridia bacterium]
MSKLSLRHLYKVYPNGVKAVNDFNMEIEDKEFIVFVGPSGCGKSTTLRMIAGLEEITAGELYIGDQFANHMEPKDRDIAMVFQNYALYPHMTVYENLAFGLNLRHVPQAEIHKKVLWAAKILKLEEYLERKPKALSGGQRQRVSLGRAILRTPKVFLLDEPLSNLDAKLRTEMRAEIAKLHNEIGTTFIYVTHDQVEAMTMGTRIVVMSMGYVQQIDTPQNLYNYPQNKFVAGFIGTPQMNFFDATLLRKGDVVEIRFDGLDNVLTIPFDQMLKVRPEYLTGDKKIIIGLRCENISADAKIVAESKNIMQVKISHFEELGNETLIYGDFNLDVHGLGDSKTSVIVKNYGGQHSCRIGDVINVAVDISKAHFFDGTTEETIAPRVPTENVFDVAIDGANISLLD